MSGMDAALKHLHKLQTGSNPSSAASPALQSQEISPAANTRGCMVSGLKVLGHPQVQGLTLPTSPQPHPHPTAKGLTHCSQLISEETPNCGDSGRGLQTHPSKPDFVTSTPGFLYLLPVSAGHL